MDTALTKISLGDVYLELQHLILINKGSCAVGYLICKHFKSYDLNKNKK